MAIIKNHRLEYEVGQIDVTYPKNDKETYFGSVPVIVPNNWTPPKPPPQPGKMPVKGDLISLDEKQYRVLKINDTIAEVVAMYNSTDSQAFGSNNTYKGNALDTYCNETFYGTLSAAMKTAIVEKTFTQDEWTQTSDAGILIYNGTYVGFTSQSTVNYILGLSNAAYDTAISRKCYALSIQDVIDYLEVTTAMTSANTTLTNTNIWQMFWKQSTSPGSGTAYNILFRSAYKNLSTQVFRAFGRDGAILDGSATNAASVRPAFQIDLSKIDFKEV